MSILTTDKSEAFTKAVGHLLGEFITFIIDGVIVKWVWNTLFLTFVHLPTITYVQALLLIITCGILFKQRIVTTIEKKF
jgi:hypothetical protein